jgi:hypothetical protein
MGSKISFHAGVVLVCLSQLGAGAWGCGGPSQEPPSQEKIQQQLKEDADMRAEEDRLEKEASGTGTKR